LLREALFVPETKKLDDLLREMQQRRIHMVIVFDEYSSVAGLVTIEDLVEEIVGDIQDEYDREEKIYEQLNESTYIFDAKISIDDFNEIMDTELDNQDYDTLAGFLYAQLDKIPNNGDSVTFQDLKFTVLMTRGRRITKVRVERIQPPQTTVQQIEGGQSGQLMLPAPPKEEHEAQARDTSQERSKTSSEEPSHYEYRGT
jgi:CBS domain containing-hemolysin-like protein